ncbi:MAG: signal peptidase II [Phycisphaerales bacterium]|nr:signal peptidase II [Phycisphaerales bacterium]
MTSHQSTDSSVSQETVIQCDVRSSRSRRAWIIFVSTTIIGSVADLWSKAYAFKHVAGSPVQVSRADVLSTDHIGSLIPQHEPVNVIENVLEYTLVLNPGAVFGIGAGQRWFFIGFTVAAVVIAVTLFLRWTRPKDWLAHVGFGLIIAGGLGNLYDRLMFACVRDFLHPFPGVKLPLGLKWPGGNTELWPYVSNVADAFLIFGIIMLMIHAWRMPNPVVESKDPEQTPEQA